MAYINVRANYEKQFRNDDVERVDDSFVGGYF